MTSAEKVYLISSANMERASAFHYLVSLLSRIGVEVLNNFPVPQNYPESILVDSSKRDSLEQLLKADFVILLPHWEESRRCVIEKLVAEHLGVPVLYCDLEQGVLESAHTETEMFGVEYAFSLADARSI